ncbi:hypothetical protein FB567DRAFT_526599 [Paraphoma chrysanthemicola]|uniref:FAD/NAD(P)-binding domain-containing protein n=1 Tax=Paraphoma chrysanthemicola TaxID=798071 RepID=A0A8K0R6R0_9PLEO|nr:hypothetical protein FB567DRAFT_526599 [Paraphoma chrysanthemicola]
MLGRTFSIFLLACLQVIFAVPHDASFSQSQVIERDVAVIGGGAAGTFASVRLREDYNTSIVLIEPKSHLGGHVSTYLVPETNTTLEYGVQSYVQNGPEADFFARFGVSTQPFAARRLTPINVEITTGGLLKNYTTPSANATNEAFGRWLAIVSKYESFLEPGYWDFPQPPNIPADFLIPFEDFAKTHQLEAAVPRIIAISGVGYGGIRDLLTLHIFQAFGATLTRQVLENRLLTQVGSNSLVYQRALALLSDDVLLSSTIQTVKRTETGAEILVTQGKKQYTIRAKRLLFTAPPSLTTLAQYGLDDKETSALSKWTIPAEFVAVVKIPCIPENTSVSFLPSAAAPSNQLALKDWPYSLRLDSTGPSGSNLFRIIFGSNTTLPAEEFKKIVTTSVHTLQEAGTIQGNCSVDFKAISEHTRPQWKLTPQQLKDGFVQELYALQGYRATWYTGYAWAAPYSSTVWAFTDDVLVRLLADLK